MANQSNWSIHDVSPTKYLQKTKREQEPLPPMQISNELNCLLAEANYSTKFKLGKYKGKSFDEVWVNDKAYYSWLITECEIRCMKVDRDNATKWIESKINQVKSQPQIPSF